MNRDDRSLRRLTFPVLPALLLTVLVHPPLAEAQATGLRVERRVLENGLEVIVAPSGSVPLAAVEVVVHNGAFTQMTPDEEGLPHLVEHMLFKSRGDLQRRASDLDGAYNGTTGMEAVTYYIVLPSENLEGAMELMADILRDPAFRDSDLLDERRVVQNELERENADPLNVFRWYRDVHLWGSALGRKSPGGNVAALQATTGSDLKRYYRRFYLPNNAAVLVTGAVEPERAFELAEEAFGRWEAGDDPFDSLEIPPIEPLRGDTVFVLPAQASEVTLSVSWHGPSFTSDPGGAVVGDVVARVANSASGPLQRALVESGMFQEVVLGYQPLKNVAGVTLMARTTANRLPGAAMHLQRVLTSLDDPRFFTDADVEVAKASLRVETAFREESVAVLAHRIARDWSLGGVEYFEAYESAVEGITPDQARAFARRYLLDGHRVVGLLVSEETIAEHQEALLASLQGWIRP